MDAAIFLGRDVGAAAPSGDEINDGLGVVAANGDQCLGGRQALNQFSDGYPVLVVGQASLDELNVRLGATGSGPVGIERFRPNVVVSGMESHDEDWLDTVHIETPTQSVVFELVKPCPRCPIPNIDPVTALSSPEEIGRAHV